MIGYLASPPSAPSRLTAMTASTARPLKNSAFCEPMILELMAVRAAETRKSRSIFSVLTVRFALMYLTASFTARR